MEQIIAIIILAFCGSVLALIGGVVFLLNPQLSIVLERYAIPFAAGVLITVSLLGLMPETIEHLGETTFWVVLLTFVSAYVFERLLFQVHHHGYKLTDSNYQGAVPLVILGDTIHNLVDGIAIASSYLTAPGLGIVTTLSTFLHEVPHEIGDFGILLKAGWRKKQILAINLLSSLTTIIGALLVILIMPQIWFVDWMLAVSAGLFLYLGASDFLPNIETGPNKSVKTTIAFLIGVLVMVITLTLIPHSE